ncbi:MAG: ATP-binding protein, partial [Myxococcales bacterium]
VRRRPRPRSPRARARPTVLREVLHFLLENAFHAAAFARSPDPWIRVAGRTEGETVVVEISDSGPGIPASDRERIFDPYVTTKKGGDQPLGTGLGLAMARDYAKHIGAEVGLDTRRAETCFFIRLVAWRDAS